MDDQFAGLIGLIYETVFDDGLWPEVLVRLADLSGADVPAIGIFDPRMKRASTIAPRTDPADVQKFETYWAERSPLFSDLAGVPQGAVVDMHSLGPVAAIKETAVYNELLRPMGLGSSALLANIEAPSGPQAVLGLYKHSPHHDQPFEQKKGKLVSTLVRHITRAIELKKEMSALRLREEGAFVALDRLRKGVLVFDATGALIFASALAARMLDTAGGSNGNPPEPIAELAQKAIATREGETVTWPRGSDRSPLQLSILPLRANEPASSRPWFGFFNPAAMVVLTDPDLETERWARAIRQRYGLTAAEASFALEIAKGDGRHAAARRRGISVSTAHTHLNRIFEKTGVTRQAELVRVLLQDDP